MSCFWDEEQGSERGSREGELRACSTSDLGRPEPFQAQGQSIGQDKQLSLRAHFSMLHRGLSLGDGPWVYIPRPLAWRLNLSQ